MQGTLLLQRQPVVTTYNQSRDHAGEQRLGSYLDTLKSELLCATCTSLDRDTSVIRMITLNASGLCLDSAFRKLLYEAKRWKKKRGLAILCIQEHNLRAQEEKTYRKKAIAAG